MVSKPDKDISMLFKVNTWDGLTFLLGLQEGMVKDKPMANEVYLKSIDVIDFEKGIVKVSGPYTKEFLVTLVEKAGGKRISDQEAVRAYHSSTANYEFNMIDINTDYTEH